MEIAPIANRRMHWLRVGLWVLLAFVLVAPTVQAQLEAAKRQRAREATTRAEDRKALGKEAKGAMARWRTAVEEFWTPGKNIYTMPPTEPSPGGSYQKSSLHPNMPFTVMLLTPFARLPVWAMVLSWNLLKIAAVLGSLFMLARVVSHGPGRVPDLVMLLAFAWAAPMIAGDFQHANTNCFVLVAVVGHLWLYRRGADYLAGLPLALAVCLKLTPALFVLYWIYQRNVRLLIGTLMAMVLFMGVIPQVALGSTRATELTMTWWQNLIRPGLVEGRAYPIHINQSIPGLLQRLLIGSPQKEGDISWNSDDDPYYQRLTRGDKEADSPQWIALANLSPAQAGRVIRVAQLAIVALGLWGIGWRSLARDDGRRGLHYGLIVAGMMLLNQRTWDHHATVMLVAGAGVWYALAAGNVGPRARAWAFWLMIVAGVTNWLNRGDFFKGAAVGLGYSKDVGEHWGNLYDAYGPVCVHFLLVFAATLILSVALRKSPKPYRTIEPPAEGMSEKEKAALKA